ncbi:MAG: bifunctional (p)ppGpp synthetase/guanosine-3',5'-bis(diphosphate) 3'-pyrophosphohydrolase [Clostridia bacterium]|nr:bifunctional (p)ppGpp synthetase/guanosine-3',5'-bis(diphosphate) 3'-pyrophosphohydrolase [Clostridia bacterium]
MLQQNALKEKYGEKETDKIFKLIAFLSSNEKFSQKLIDDACDIAEIVIKLKLDSTSVCAALVFPYILKNLSFVEEFSNDSELYQILQSLLKCEEYSKNYTDANGLKEMLIAITKDIRVIIIKIAQMLVEARKSVRKFEDKKATELFKIIDDIFMPIAARLGLSEVKSEFQDLSFEFHEPREYEKLKEEVKKETRANKHMINKIVNDIKTLLSSNGIDCTCYGRIKHLSSIHNKIVYKNYSLKQIYDIAAVRILVKNMSECYTALGIVHSSYIPVDGRFKDYIANPKQNGYQSLHTTVYADNELFEIQIRTFEMHDFAEYGVAAHFLYKEHKKSFSGVDGKLLWIRKMLENKENVSTKELLEELKTDVYLGEIFVQTPMGKVVKLVENATPIDFAYLIHTDIGNRCVGARVNGRMVPLTSPLSNGDVVEIITSQNSKGPSRDWIKKVKMQGTRDKINYFFKKQMKDENIKLGKSMVEQYAKSNDIVLNSLLQERWIEIILRKTAFSSLDELYAAIGYGSMTSEKFVKRLQTLKRNEELQSKTILDSAIKGPVKIENKYDIVGAEGTLTKYCKCCNPIPGDEIVGYVSRGRGIIIHKNDCPAIKNLAESRFIKVDWNLQSANNLTFTASIDIVAKNKSNIYFEITNALNELGIKVSSINTTVNKNEELLLKIGVEIKDKEHLTKLKNKLSSLESVYEVL